MVIPFFPELHLSVEQQGCQFFVVEPKSQIDGISGRVAYQDFQASCIARLDISRAVHIEERRGGTAHDGIVGRETTAYGP